MIGALSVIGIGSIHGHATDSPTLRTSQQDQYSARDEEQTLHVLRTPQRCERPTIGGKETVLGEDNL